MEAVITLTTDFGLSDAYVAAMKGVILSINPRARLVDVCHSIRPYDIKEAAFIFSTAFEFFPAETIHLVIVDPGVGTGRRAVILKTPSAYFIAPDNGVLTYVAQPFLTCFDFAEEAAGTHQVEFRPEMEAVVITNPRFWRSPVSPTFHGRDVFAPVAAHLSLGQPLADFGERLTSISALSMPRPRQETDGSIVGHIIHIDNFGNLITDIRGADIAGPTVTVEIGRRLISGLSHTYASTRELALIIGSSGYLEIALSRGNAARLLKAKVGDEIRARYLSGG